MKRRSKMKRTAAAGCAAITLTASLISFLPSSALADPADGKVQTYEEQIAGYEREQEEAEARRLEALQNLNDAEAYRDALYESIELMDRKLETYSSMIVEIDKQIEEKNKLIAETEKDIEEKKEQFLLRMTSMYEDGTASYLDLILGATDISDFLSRVDNVNEIMEYDQKLIDSFTESKKALTEARSELEAARKSQEDALGALQNNRDEYMALLDEANKSVSLYEGLMSSAEQDALDAKVAAQQIDSELAAYLAELAEQQRQEQLTQEQPTQNNGSTTPETWTNYVSGEYMWPLDSYYYISSNFGWRFIFGRDDFHPATDIAANEGTQIHAAAGGTVVRSEWNDSYGYYVLIDHGNGKSTLYAHQCQPPYVNPGDTVTIGQVIGLVGTTGDSTGPHLHFEFRVNGQTVDATQYVAPPHQ